VLSKARLKVVLEKGAEVKEMEKMCRSESVKVQKVRVFVHVHRREVKGVCLWVRLCRVHMCKVLK